MIQILINKLTRFFTVQVIAGVFCSATCIALGCSSQTMEEPPQISSVSHNEAAIDRYLDDLVSTESRKLTGFTEAARWGRIELVEQLIEDGTEVDAQDEYGRTALILASEGGQLEVMRYLIEQGADVNFQDPKSGETPLLALFGSLHSEGIYYSGTEILHDAGANFDVQARNGQSLENLVDLRINEDRLRKEFLLEQFPSIAD